MWNEKQIIEQLRDERTRERAFAELVEHFKEQLYWQIRRMVFSHDDADDVLQNTFIKAWTGLDSFRGDSQLGTWLFRIANNETLNFLDRNHLQTSLDDEAAVGVAARLESDPYFDGDETELLLHEAIAALPDNQCGCPEGLVSSCRKKDFGLFPRSRLNLLPPQRSKHRIKNIKQ